MRILLLSIISVLIVNSAAAEIPDYCKLPENFENRTLCPCSLAPQSEWQQLPRQPHSCAYTAQPPPPSAADICLSNNNIPIHLAEYCACVRHTYLQTGQKVCGAPAACDRSYGEPAYCYVFRMANGATVYDEMHAVYQQCAKAAQELQTKYIAYCQGIKAVVPAVQCFQPILQWTPPATDFLDSKCNGDQTCAKSEFDACIETIELFQDHLTGAADGMQLLSIPKVIN